MKSIISLILCLSIISLSVQARSVDTIESDFKTEISKKQLPSVNYLKLLTYLKNQVKNDDDDDNNDLSSINTQEVKPKSKREFFLFPGRRSSQKTRPTYTYGRKSHWDTFFG